jgi:hypothetical protein
MELILALELPLIAASSRAVGYVVRFVNNKR